jgi:hypothetical protein
LSVKFFFYFVKKWGYFCIAFRKSGGARVKTNLKKKFYCYLHHWDQKEISFPDFIGWDMTNFLIGSFFPFSSLPGNHFYSTLLCAPCRIQLGSTKYEGWYYSNDLKWRPTDKTFCLLPQGARRRVQKMVNDQNTFWELRGICGIKIWGINDESTYNQNDLSRR